MFDLIRRVQQGHPLDYELDVTKGGNRRGSYRRLMTKSETQADLILET
jgi:hypothetical protein